MFKCPVCGAKRTTQFGMYAHLKGAHNMSSDDAYYSSGDTYIGNREKPIEYTSYDYKAYKKRNNK
jgi:hypothetical protein